jgi:starch-binding outer membrane protein, SusD/RagB family
MKTKNIVLLLLFLFLFLGSCTNYLKENNKTGMTDNLVYTTEANISSLVASCYSYNRLWYGKEAAFNLSEGGTDLWYDGKDNAARDLVTYKSVTPDYAAGCFADYWEAFYTAINLCNLADKKAREDKTMSEVNKLYNQSQVRFLRAFYYWHLVEMFGAVQLNLEPITAPSTVAYRDPVDTIYAHMFKDVQFAIDNLSPAVVPSSRVTHWAARALKARLALYYASEYGKTEYFQIAANEAKAVIAGSGKSFYAKYDDVWDQAKSATNKNNEYIWGIDYYNDVSSTIPYNMYPPRLTYNSADNSGDWSTLIIRTRGNGQGNVMHVICAPIWNSLTDATGGKSIGDVLKRAAGSNSASFYTVASPSTLATVDVGYFYVRYAMGYTRFAPTRYALDVFDERIDQRYNTTFRSAWYKHPSVVPKFWPNASTCAYPKMSVGTQTDTCVYYSKRPLTAAQIAWANGRYKILDVNNTFLADGITPNALTSSTGANYFFVMLRKFEDTDSKITLPQATFQDYFTYRDFPIFRLSEMYLIAAEALMGTDQPQAVTLVNTLRTARAIPGKTVDMQVTSVDLNFILAERAREFIGEDIRWFDLKRTKKLKAQLIANNPRSSVNFDETKHYLRPIPAIQMQSVSNRSDAPETGKFWQNPGY